MTARPRTLRPTLSTLSTAVAKPPPKLANPFYASPEWIKARNLARRCLPPVCARCGQADTRLWVDHIHELKDGGAPFDLGNLQLLCAPCHTRKSVEARAQRQGGRGGSNPYG
jgi:5-methylcytosine-specific restriction enzyme A